MFKVKIITIVILAIIYFTLPESHHYGFVEGGHLWQHFTYPLFHASFLHLIINSYVFYGLMRTPVIKPIYILLFAYIISVLASFLSCTTLPTVGFSGIIFALCGIGIAQYPTRINLLLSVIAIGATFLMSGSNPYIHLYSWLGGFLVGFVIKFYKTKVNQNDTSRNSK